jgi:hypothetical protein
MEIAQRIELTLSSDQAGSLSDLIVGMRITAGTKNPYRIYFPKTDVHGCTALEQVVVLGQFKDHWEEGLMDFNGTLESASQSATFFLFNVRDLQTNLKIALAWPLLTYEKTVWRSRREQVDYFLSCRNDQYSLPETDVPIPRNGQVHLRVHRR